MRIAILIFRYFQQGGLQRDAVAIASLLQARGHAITVFARVWEGPHPAGVTVHTVPVAGRSNHARDASFAERALALAKGFDLVVGFNRIPGVDIAYIADPCFRALNSGSARALYRMTPRYAAYAALEEGVFRPQAKTHVLLLTGNQADAYRRCYGTPPERIHLVPPGIAMDRRRPDDAAARRAMMRHNLRLTETNLCLLLVAADFATKGLDRAIRAVAALAPPLRERVRLFAVGSEDAVAYHRLARRLGVAERVQVLGPSEDVLSYMLAADLLVHPARREAAGLVILEALAAGLPVLCTGVCGHAEHVVRAEAGRVLEEPFAQPRFNATLAETLASGKLPAWSRNAADYARNADFYRGREVAADLIEALGKQLKRRS